MRFVRLESYLQVDSEDETKNSGDAMKVVEDDNVKKLLQEDARKKTEVRNVTVFACRGVDDLDPHKVFFAFLILASIGLL
jgi:hypothetical protein